MLLGTFLAYTFALYVVVDGDFCFNLFNLLLQDVAFKDCFVVDVGFEVERGTRTDWLVIVVLEVFILVKVGDCCTCCSCFFLLFVAVVVV